MVKGRWRKLFLLVFLALLLCLPAGVVGWASLHHHAAKEALRRRDYATAQKELGPSLRVWFWSAEPHLLAARAARGQAAYDEAERHLRACRNRGGNDGLIELEHLLLRAQRGDVAAVEGALFHRVEQHPDEAPLIMEVLAPQYFQTYQLHKARWALTTWLKQEPDWSPAWLLLAQCHERLGSTLDAQDCYRRTLELDPDHVHARLQLAGLLVQANPQEALSHMEYVRNLQGESATVLRGLATCRHALNEPEEARRLLDRLLASHPDDGAALAARARLAREYESVEQAEQWFRRAAQRMPFERDVLYGFCTCLEQNGKTQEANSVRERLRQVDEDLARLATVTRRIAAMPQDPDLRCEAGEILLRNGQAAEGARWLQSALMVNPAHARAHQLLADFYETTGEKERAAQHRQLALAGKP